MNFTKQNDNDKQIDIYESYNVILTSSKPYETPASNNDVNYAIDWSFLPDQPYNVHFTYLVGLNNLDGSKVANIFVDFGCTNNTYTASNAVSSQNSNYLGVLKPYVLGGSSFLLAEDNTNPPIYIGERPRNNIFNVSIFDLSHTLFTPTSGSLASYRLNLKFVPIKINE
jgi:hypothetical protein